MTLSAADFSGRVTFVTGTEKGSGKTTLLNYALGLARAAGEAPAFLGVGFDGEASLAGERAARIACRAGEVFVSAERFLRSSGCLPELLEALPGSTALGRLAVARARRDGQAVLVGAERNDYTGLAIDAIREGGWASTILVDGAMNRVTQVSSLRGARFLCAVRAEPGGLDRNVRAMARLLALSRLPASSDPGLAGPRFKVEGPLTAGVLARLPADAGVVVVDDFTNVFLDLPELARLAPRSGEAPEGARVLAAERAFEFGGFVVALRDISRGRFLDALRGASGLGEAELDRLLAFDPYEAAA